MLFARAIRPDPLSRACDRRHCNRAARARRALAAGKAGRARGRRTVDRCCIRAWAARARGGNDGRDSGWPAHSAGPGAAAARCGGDCPARRRMPAARLYRERLCRAHLRCQARICPGPTAGVSRHRRGQSRDGAGTGLSRGRRPVAIGRERQGRRAHPARSRLRLNGTLALCLLFLTGLLENLPKAVLAAVVLTAVYGLLDFPALFRMWRVSRLDFYAAAVALGAVLLLGILEGILIAALASIVMLLARVSRPHVAFLGRVPGTSSYSDLARHPENETLAGVIAFRPEASLIYVNADAVLESVLNRLRYGWPLRHSPGGLRSLGVALCRPRRLAHAARVAQQLAARGIALRIVGAHGWARDLLRADGIGEKVQGLGRVVTLDNLLSQRRPSA